MVYITIHPASNSSMLNFSYSNTDIYILFINKKFLSTWMYSCVLCHILRACHFPNVESERETLVMCKHYRERDNLSDSKCTELQLKNTTIVLIAVKWVMCHTYITLWWQIAFTWIPAQWEVDNRKHAMLHEREKNKEKEYVIAFTSTLEIHRRFPLIHLSFQNVIDLINNCAKQEKI